MHSNFFRFSYQFFLQKISSFVPHSFRFRMPPPARVCMLVVFGTVSIKHFISSNLEHPGLEFSFLPDQEQRLFNLNETVLCNERTLSLAQIGNSFKMILKMFHVCTHYRRLDYLPYQISHFSLNTDADQGCIRRAKVWVQYPLICQNLRLWKKYLLV